MGRNNLFNSNAMMTSTRVMCQQQIQPAATSQHSSHRLTVTHVATHFFFFFFLCSRNAESWRLKSATTDRVTEFLAITQLNMLPTTLYCRHFCFVCLLKDFRVSPPFFSSFVCGFYLTISRLSNKVAYNSQPTAAAAASTGFKHIERKESINQKLIA